MLKYFITMFLIAGGVSFMLTPLVRRLSLRMGWMDDPNERKVNLRPMPRVGGMAIYAGFVLSLLFLVFKGPVVFDTQKVIGLLGSSFIIVLVGIEDDIRGLSPRRKLFYQATAALIAYLYGYNITRMSHFFGETFQVPWVLGMLLTIFWIIGFTNAINLVDGLDGLAAGVVSIIAMSIFFTALKDGHLIVAILCIGVAGSALGFLPFNFYPAKIFMGDTGSMFLGFMIALISIEGSFKSETFVTLFVPIVAMGVPVVDTGLSILRRLIKGNGINGIFKADKEHVHHKLLTQEGSQRNAVLKLYFLTICFGSIAIGLSGMRGIWAFFGTILVIVATLRWIFRFELIDLKNGGNGDGNGDAP
jgi:UDP-GlcNAc:undecaprenyl-phosphate GlcNAc-1-phosphate transferase